jgi:A/G-specific adenine glycosylase
VKSSYLSVNNKIHMLSEPLLKWYDTNARVLPWRAPPGEEPNPYYVLLSEFMLQQTTVQTVTPYFQVFVERWPTLGAFACASEEEVLTHWQGLGYYARARNLLKAAKAISALDHWPRDITALQQLPGIGPYTARAIASIAFNQPFLPVDGNFIRLLGRVWGMEGTKDSVKKTLQQQLDSAAYDERPGDLAQAIMDFANTLCRPQNPQCNLCPLYGQCQGREPLWRERVEKNRTPKRTVPTRFAVARLTVNDAGAIWLTRNTTQRLLKGLLMPPLHYVSVEAFDPLEAPTVSHTFSHFRLQVKVVAGGGHSPSTTTEAIWVPLGAIQKYPLSTLAKKILKAGSVL